MRQAYRLGWCIIFASPLPPGEGQGEGIKKNRERSELIN